MHSTESGFQGLPPMEMEFINVGICGNGKNRTKTSRSRVRNLTTNLTLIYGHESGIEHGPH